MSKDRSRDLDPKVDMALQVGAKVLHEGRRFMYEELERYHGTFLDPATGMFRSELLEKRVCPVCAEDDARRLFDKRGGVYVKCRRCEMCYLNPVFTDEALRAFYENNNTIQSQVVKNESEFYRRILGKGLLSVEHFTAGRDLLDVGCSAGFFLDLARERGWSTSGIELNKAEVAEAIEKGHRIFTVPLESASFPDKFDAITLWDVFEHIKDGYSMLDEIGKNLRPGGVLFLQTPSFDALAARVMQEKCNMFDGLEHVNIYSPRTLPRMAERAGFEILHMETVISEIPIVHNFLSYEDPYFGSTPHGGKVLGLLDEETIHRNMLGYKMQAVLRPR